MIKKPEWCAANWQAHIEKIPTFEGRKKAIEEAPAEMRNRIKRHLITVRNLSEKKR